MNKYEAEIKLNKEKQGLASAISSIFFFIAVIAITVYFLLTFK